MRLDSGVHQLLRRFVHVVFLLAAFDILPCGFFRRVAASVSDGNVLRIEGAGAATCYTPRQCSRISISVPTCRAKGLPGTLWRLKLETPVINRSDGSRFHLSLFSGAEYVPAPSGGIAGNRLLGDFRCVHDEFGDSASPSIVVLTNPGDSHEGVRRQLEEAADQLAEVLQRNVRPSQRYDFDGVALEARAG